MNLVLPERAAGYVKFAEISVRLKTDGQGRVERFSLVLNGQPLKVGRNFLQPGREDET